MFDLTRRHLMLAGVAAWPLSVSLARAEEPPTGGMSLIEALKLRRSTREYADKPLAAKTLDTLLWCAFGVNRKEEGGRTAPSWYGSRETDIYVATAEGVTLYEPVEGKLKPVLDRDIRKETSPEPFVRTAPAVLVYVADRARMHAAPKEEQIQAAYVDSAIIGENVYLYCASAGLGTCLVGGVDAAAIGKDLSLSKDHVVTYVQPVGYPK